MFRIAPSMEEWYGQGCSHSRPPIRVSQTFEGGKGVKEVGAKKKGRGIRGRKKYTEELLPGNICITSSEWEGNSRREIGKIGRRRSSSPHVRSTLARPRKPHQLQAPKPDITSFPETSRPRKPVNRFWEVRNRRQVIFEQQQ